MADLVLIVDDDEAVQTMLYKVIRSNSLEAHTASSGEQALQMVKAKQYDLILLDVNMRGMDGFEVVRALRARGVKTPIIIVSGRQEDYDTLYGLDIGADDYVTKPFSIKELSARIKANIRRTVPAPAAPQEPVGEGFGPWVLDKKLQALTREGRVLDLTQREFDIIAYFLSMPQRVVSREELMEKVWGYEYYGDLRTVDVAMRRLREKLEEDPANPKYFITKRGAGYYLQK
jgi:two-component system response regulator VicR